MNVERIQKTTKAIGDVVAKNSPTILTGMSVAGLIATTVMGIKATPKAIRILEEVQVKKYRDPMTTKEVIAETWKCYLPTIAMGTVTVGCIIGANSINLRRNAALASLYSISETALKEYQAKVVEKIGEKGHREIREAINQEKIVRNPASKNIIIATGKGDTLCYDAWSGRYFWSDPESINRSLNDLSRRLMTEHFISLNDVYYDLSLDGVKSGDYLGWHIDMGLIEPNFSSEIAEDGRPCLVLDFEVAPRYYDRDF